VEKCPALLITRCCVVLGADPLWRGSHRRWVVPGFILRLASRPGRLTMSFQLWLTALWPACGRSELYFSLTVHRISQRAERMRNQGARQAMVWLRDGTIESGTPGARVRDVLLSHRTGVLPALRCCQKRWLLCASLFLNPGATTNSCIEPWGYEHITWPLKRRREPVGTRVHRCCAGHMSGACWAAQT
jgi:hypothetical protein